MRRTRAATRTADCYIFNSKLFNKHGDMDGLLLPYRPQPRRAAW
ncbi:hypothetical protein ACAN107058_08310 [Paracidovorax anthurii]|uniref:Uncharacterized protein n=1 Tax=Paracidovorax anthurii TaxID=78229 RepID=A0A328ZM48_9BURK|nr:hypothetical protein AX018_100171 [Paracidovorax anthurii]